MTRSNAGLRAGALLCFVLADGVAAHPRPLNTIKDVRLIGAVDAQSEESAYQTGKRLLASGDVSGALSAFRRALASSPESLDAMNGIGVCYDRFSRADLARKFYQAGLALDPTSPTLLNNLGYSFFLDGDYAAAKEPLSAAAASADAAAATAARATLALVVAQAATNLADAILAPAPPAARIELTTDGEQRLTFAPAIERPSSASSLGDDATVVLVAAAWTTKDDNVLMTQVQREELADAAQLAAERDLDAAASPIASPVLLVATTPVPSNIPAVAPPVPATVAIARASINPQLASALVLSKTDTGTLALRRREASDQRGAVTLTGDGPKANAIALFESDDAELNAFAARVGVHSAVARSTLPVAGDRIAARFRT